MTTDKSMAWQEDDSQSFLKNGRYFVPERERQIDIMTALITPLARPFRVLELACGEGLLAQRLLDQFATCSVVGLDGSPLMLARAQARLAAYGDRFEARPFSLAAAAWRQKGTLFQAVVSSLTIHHLDGPGKLRLFQDILALLAPGGTLVIADLVQPAHAQGTAVAAAQWDEAVRRRALELDGDTAAFERFQQTQWNIYHYPPAAEDGDRPSTLLDQLIWLQQAGFTGVDVHWLHAGHAVFSGHKPAVMPHEGYYYAP